MSVDKNVPEIRFKGFSEAWVDSDLKSFSDSFSYGLNASAVKFDGVNKYLRITDIDEKSRRFDYCQLTSPNADLSKSDNYLLKNGDIVFARTGASVGKTYIYNEQDGKVYFAGFLIRASINHKASAQFIFQNTQTHEYARFVATTSQRSGQPGINAKEYGEYRLLSPSEPEQTQIGNYFQKLDALINQHQQKHDKFSNIKKAMLKKMFPKQGETIPEIRFKGFSGEWVEHSWSDTVDISTSMVDPRNCQYGELFHVGPGNIESLTGRFYDNVLKVKDSNLISGKFHFNKGDIIYGKINPQLAKYVIAPFEGLASADAYVLNTKNGVVQHYLFAILHTEDFYKYTVSVSSRTGMPKINRDELNIYSYMAPSESEQAKIGNFFQKLDTLINQHQQQITKLNNIKQACLSKMFV